MKDRVVRVYRNRNPNRVARAVRAALDKGQGVVLTARRRDDLGPAVAAVLEPNTDMRSAGAFSSEGRSVYFIWREGGRIPSYTYWSEASHTGPVWVDFSDTPDGDD